MNLATLHIAVDKVIKLIIADESLDFGESIRRRADLHCPDVRAWVDSHGTTGVTATVVGASPDAVNLREYIAAELHKRGYGSIYVETKW
jgi:hypothetical protein